MSLRASKGQEITAEHWNRVVDGLPGDLQGFGVGGGDLARSLIKVKNDSGNDREMGEVLAIDSFDGPSDEFDALKTPHFVASDPVWHSDVKNSVVLAEPIPDGEFGWAVISGLAIAKLSADGDFAMVDPSTINSLKGAASGTARVLGTVGSGYYMVDLGKDQRLWRYTLTEDSQAPAGTAATLRDVGGTTFGSITLSDPESLMSDQISGDTGYCIHVGNSFHAIAAVC